MSQPPRRALFTDLLFNEMEEPVKTVTVGGVPHYVVPDEGFLRHVEAETVDRQIVAALKEHILRMRDAVVEGMVQLLGQEDLFTRPAIEQAIENMERILEPGAVDVDELRTALWMAKFRAVVNMHGELVKLDLPGLKGEDYE